MPRIQIPSLLRPLCSGERELTVPGGKLDAVLRAVDELCPGFYDRVVDSEEHRVRVELAIALNGEVVNLYLHEFVAEDANLAIVPAIAGG